MALDEAWSGHEKLIGPMRSLLVADKLGIFYFAWVIPGIALVLVLALVLFKFVLHLPANTRRDLLPSVLRIGRKGESKRNQGSLGVS